MLHVFPTKSNKLGDNFETGYPPLCADKMRKEPSRPARTTPNIKHFLAEPNIKFLEHERDGCRLGNCGTETYRKRIIFIRLIAKFLRHEISSRNRAKSVFTSRRTKCSSYLKAND